jgi:hypothetical protein
LGTWALHWYRYAGPALTLATLLAAATLLSINLLLLRIWLTPTAFGLAVGTVVLTNPRSAASLVRAGFGRVQWRQFAVGTLLAIPIAGLLAVAVGGADDRDIFRVQDILDDPSSVHVSTSGTGGPK